MAVEQMVSTDRPLMTAEQLWEMPRVSCGRIELVKGTLFEMPGTGYERGSEDELDGGDMLPGFRVRVAEIFAAAASDEF